MSTPATARVATKYPSRGFVEWLSGQPRLAVLSILVLMAWLAVGLIVLGLCSFFG